ncbi:MAG TPA: hypothetical protein VF807_12990 [Ktedonobacterales bacterium]
MRLIPPRLVLILACAVLVVALPACAPGGSSGSQPTHAVTVAPSGHVVQVSNTQHFANSLSGGTTAPCANGDSVINGNCGETLTATCASGDQLLSGGYLVDDTQAYVTATYPASASTWSVTAHDEAQNFGSVPFTLTVFAQCLHANVSAGITIASATPQLPDDQSPQAAEVDCPASTMVTGGGYRASFYPSGSSPVGAAGWAAVLGMPTGATVKPSVYALCARSHLTPLSQPKVTADARQLSQGTVVAAQCPSGSLLVGGGATTTGVGESFTRLAADSTSTVWQAALGTFGLPADPSIAISFTVVGVCATLA